MLEQFRTLEAALRLVEFTAAQLARESGVAEGTVQKTLQRHAELFDKSEGPRTGRPGGQPRLYKVRQAARSSLAAAVQAAVDEPELPPLPTKSTGELLGLLLAEDTLLRVIPRAARGDRRKLLSAVNSQFALAGLPKEAAKADSLQALHETLVSLVDYQEWLEAALKRSSQSIPYRTWQKVIDAIECILSFKERQDRQDNPERLDWTIKLLERLALDVGIVSLTTTGPPHLIDIPAVVRSLLLHPRWQDVIGDLPVGRLVGRLLQPTRVGYNLSQIASAPKNLTTPDLNPGFRVRIVPDLGVGDLPVYSAAPLAANVITDPYAAQRQVGQIVALDLGFVSRTVTRVIMARGIANQAMMFPYSTLRFGLVGHVVSFGKSVPFAWFIRSATPHGIAIPLRDAFYGAKAGKVIETTIAVGGSYANRIGGFEFAHVNKLGLRIDLGAGSRVDVYGPPHGNFFDDATMTTGYSMELAQKVGELIGMDLDPNTGILINAYVQEVVYHHVNKIPFETLDYRTVDNCFVLHSVPETQPGSASENIWGNAHRPWTSNIHKEPDLPTWIVPPIH